MKLTYFVAQTQKEGKWSALLLALPVRTDLVSYWKEYLPEAVRANVFKSKKEAVEFYNCCIEAFKAGVKHAL